MSIPQLDIAVAEASRRFLKTYVKQFWPVVEPTIPFVDGIHVDALCEHLEHIDQIQNLLICMPPGYAKSLMTAVFFPSWKWATNPESRFIYASHSFNLATRDSLRCRNVIMSEKYQAFYGHVYKLSEDANLKHRFENTRTGFRLSCSVDGGVTGERANYLVADDLHDLSEIESRTRREFVVRWYNEVFSTRTIPQKHARIVVMQRGHMEDLAENIIKNDTHNNWTKLILPLEGKKSKYISTRWKDPRAEGELLCPDLMSKQSVEQQKRLMGSRAFESQYNQNPKGTAEAIFRKESFQYYEGQPPEGGFRIATVDLAISTRGDWTVIGVWDIHKDGNLVLVHLHRERMNAPKIIPTIKAIHQAHNTKLIYIEDVAFQRYVIEDARRNGLPVKAFKPEGDKVSRSIMAQVKAENGQLFLPKDKPWLEKFEEEVCDFPNAHFDDQVDVLSIAAIVGSDLQRRLPSNEPPLTQEERQRLYNENMARRMKIDAERWKRAFTA